MHRILVLGATAAFSSALLAQSPAAAEPFTYANGDLSAVGVAGSGWDAAEGGWQVGDSTAGRRFTVTGNAVARRIAAIPPATSSGSPA